MGTALSRAPGPFLAGSGSHHFEEGYMFRKYTGKWLLLPLALIASWIAPLAVAQETTAGIQGTVRDATGGVVAGATVEMTSPALIGVRRVQTDDGGNFRIAALPPG